ncbi:MAG: type I-F CRISPR-associated helicase Cas3 [Nitrospirae bacterium]|nr:MAG: type I-F CRISPR-associated helicase Cas3 [Nitrospirota bacterium]
MHILLISACQKKALKKTRTVLDSYAIRIGERTWATPITLEGMRELRAALKRSATRQMAVACYRNDGRRSMKLLWIVGSKRPFGPDGHFPCGTVRRTSVQPLLPNWIRLVSLLASAGGLAHDIGKIVDFFQGKLAESLQNPFPKSVDPFRHEWLSMRLIQELRSGNSLDQAWERLASPLQLGELTLKRGLSGPLDVLDFIVATHHRLFGPEKGGAEVIPSKERHVREGRTPFYPAGNFPKECQVAYENILRRICKLAQEVPPGYWRGVAILARAALIFADHSISAVKLESYGSADDGLFANTSKMPGGKRQYNQPLRWHLEHVSRKAATAAYRMATLRLPALSEEAVEKILEPSTNSGRFVWQNRAVEALRTIRRQSNCPLIVMNVASTGAGKTRMNAKCACVLGPPGRVRFAVALNQRTLTLQTGDALSEQLGIGKDELATVIGDRVTIQLHAAGKAAVSGSEEDEVEFISDANLFDVEEWQDLPEWLGHFADRKPFLRRILGAPILASTIDFLISSGELNRQGNHVAALLRLIDSDVILDEIDSYDPTALMAVLRLVQMVGFCGRNLICSSATLAYPVAQAVFDAYHSGILMRSQLYGQPADYRVAVIDDLVEPTLLRPEEFHEGYQQHIAKMLPEMGKRTCRLPFLQPVREPGEDAWLEAVAEAAKRMHDQHAWSFPESGKTISFGLVRVANIRTAIKVARYLSSCLPQARIAAYHSQDFVIQRFMKERRLDFLLNRKRGNDHIVRDPEIAGIVASSEFPSVPFIVVATPVEEIGRDHDFDWAVIEPSSSQSIVQTAGRVNRHRQEPIGGPNVAILQFNYRWARGENICFCRPGLESTSFRYDSHDLAKILNWEALATGLDARLRFENHLLAQWDDQSIRAALKSPLKGLCNLAQENVAWMVESFYRDYPLRSREPKRTWRVVLDDDGNYEFQRLERCNFEDLFISRDGWVSREARVCNDWLCFDLSELRERCIDFGIRAEVGLQFELVMYGRNAPDLGPEKIIFDQSFGLYPAFRK